MGWSIQCTDSICGKQTWAANIANLIREHIDENGWLRCSCGKPGYVEKLFNLQEKGLTWKPFLRGIIPLGNPEKTYQLSFIFLVSDEPNGPIKNFWVSYYKHLRESGGKLKLGHGPGGTPALELNELLILLLRLIELWLLPIEKVKALIEGFTVKT